MAIFGFQLCFTLIMASFMQKLMPIFSFGRWLLCSGSLTRYKHPSDEELKRLAGKPNDKHTGKVRNRRNGNNKTSNQDSKTFKVPKTLDVVLESTPVTVLDTLILRKYNDYEWLVNYTLFGLIVYMGTEVYYELWMPNHEFNISMVWIALAMCFAVKNLFSVLWIYAKSKAGGEISMSVTFGMFSFVLALGVLMIKEEILDFGLGEYDSQSTLTDEEYSRKPLILTKVKLFLAGLSAFTGVLYAFPAIRMAQMYVDALKYSRENHFLQFALHINFFAPFIIVLLWIKPLVKDFLRNVSLGSDADSSLLTVNQFELARIVVIIVMCMLRLMLMRNHLQAYLNVAYVKMHKIRKESGLTTNVDLQKMVDQVYLYLGIVAMQYLSPLVLTICTVLCLKTFGGYSWKGFQESYVSNYTKVVEPAPTKTSLFDDVTVKEMVQSLGGDLINMRAGISPILLRGVFSYLVWWNLFNWFIASCMGYLYHTYLSV